MNKNRKERGMGFISYASEFFIQYSNWVYFACSKASVTVVMSQTSAGP